MKKKNFRILKKIVFTIFILFAIFNILIIIQAYHFTHFNTNASKKNFQPGFSNLLTGIDIPKPKAKTKLTRDFKTIQIPTDNKEQFLEAWLLEPEKPSKGTVIIFHGFADEKSSMLDRAYAFLDMGYKTLLVDFMGSGNSYGNQTTIGFYEAKNVKESYNYVKNTMKENSIILCGFSMGSAAVIKAEHDYKMGTKAIILEAPYGRLLDAVKVRIGKIPYVGLPCSYFITFWGGTLNGFNAFSMNPEEYIKDIKTPTLIFYGGKDPKIPTSESKRIFNNSGSPEKKSNLFPLSYHESYLKKYPKEWKSIVSNFLNSIK